MDKEAFFKQATSIEDFCKKYIEYFRNLKREPQVDRYYFIDSPVFARECTALGFEMDCGDSFIRKYGEEAFCSEEAFARIVNIITDVKVLGDGIFSQWRYYNHWAESSQALYDAVGWFKLAFNRLYELAI